MNVNGNITLKVRRIPRNDNEALFFSFGMKWDTAFYRPHFHIISAIYRKVEGEWVEDRPDTLDDMKAVYPEYVELRPFEYVDDQGLRLNYIEGCVDLIQRGKRDKIAAYSLADVLGDHRIIESIRTEDALVAWLNSRRSALKDLFAATMSKHGVEMIDTSKHLTNN